MFLLLTINLIYFLDELLFQIEFNLNKISHKAKINRLQVNIIIHINIYITKLVNFVIWVQFSFFIFISYF